MRHEDVAARGESLGREASPPRQYKKPLPALGNAEILAVKHLPLSIIPASIQRPQDDRECLAAVVTKQALDVLKQ